MVEQCRYCKTFRNGQPVTNVRGLVAAPEQLLLLTKCGVADAGELAERVMNFQVQRPSISKGYATEKKASFIDRLIQQATWPGEWLLDPFAGSGVVGERCLRLQRSSVLIERAQQTTYDFILPRLAAQVRFPPRIGPATGPILGGKRTWAALFFSTAFLLLSASTTG